MHSAILMIFSWRAMVELPKRAGQQTRSRAIASFVPCEHLLSVDMQGRKVDIETRGSQMPRVMTSAVTTSNVFAQRCAASVYAYYYRSDRARPD
jgi:hypothetical protein